MMHPETTYCRSCSEPVVVLDLDPDRWYWCDEIECAQDEAETISRQADRTDRWNSNIKAHYAGEMTRDEFVAAQDAIRKETR